MSTPRLCSDVKYLRSYVDAGEFVDSESMFSKVVSHS